MTDKHLDFNIIASDCLIAEDTDSTEVLGRLNNLKNKFGDIELIAVLNYFLKIEYRPEVLFHIVKMVDRLRDSSSMEPLTNLLLMKDRVPKAGYEKEAYTNVRSLCAKAISHLQDHSCVHTLLYCLNDKNENYKVRLSCADALGKLGDKYAVTTLMNVVSDETEKSVYIRESAAVALGLIGDVRAVDSLVQILETSNGIIDKFSYLKEKAVEALCKLNPSNIRAFNALKLSLKDESPQVRINSIEALMEYDTREARDLIEYMLKDGDEEVQRNAVIALYNIEGRPILGKILKGEYSQTCKTEAENILLEESEDAYDS